MKVLINDIEYRPYCASVSLSSDLGTHLRTVRKFLKMSLDEAAAMIGCGKGTLWELENNKAMPRLDTAASISDAYGISLALMGAYARARSREE